MTEKLGRQLLLLPAQILQAGADEVTAARDGRKAVWQAEIWSAPVVWRDGTACVAGF